MHSTTITTLALFATAALSMPVSGPTNPPPNDPNPLDFSILAGGGPPNGKLPANISNAAIADFQAVNFLENFESGFFEQAIEWLGHWNDKHQYDELLNVVTKIHAQEQVHVATAEGILKNYHRQTFKPCTYKFPDVHNVEDFVSLANTITVTGVGAVINLISGLAITDPELVPGPASILGNEARQDAFFRVNGLGLEFPEPAAFDTRISALYALSLASQFVSDCQGNMPKFTPLPLLKVEGDKKVTGSSGPITFSFDAKQVKNSTSDVFIGWVNQANVVQYTDAKVSGGKVDSSIPDGLSGFAFAALTTQNKVPDVGNLTLSTLAGPAPVRIS